MSVEIYKKPSHTNSSGAGNDLRRKFRFGVKGTSVEGIARNLTSAYYGPYIMTSQGMLFRGDIMCEQTAYNLFDTEIEYLRRPKDIGTWSWNGDGTGVTEHITHSLETVAAYPGGTPPGQPGSQCPNYGNAIGVDGDQILGADVIRPGGRFEIVFSHPAGVMTLQYFNYLRNLAGYYNEVHWLVFGPGEARFLGPRCSDGSETDATCVYQFDLQSTLANFSVGSITGVTKLGWHIAWTKSKLQEVTVDGDTYEVKVPQFVYVERVSGFTNFATAFGIS